MRKINPAGMADVERARRQRALDLDTLIATPFDINNRDHKRALQKFLNDFEFSVNKMYFYQAMAPLLPAAIGSWVTSKFIPFIPEFGNFFIAAAFYLGAAGLCLTELQLTDFDNRLQEMKKLYNWCLKNNETHYNLGIDNTLKLHDPEIQRFIKLLAPLCEKSFIIAWPPVLTPSETATDGGSWSKLFSTGYSALHATIFMFSPTVKATPEELKVDELKRVVESEALNLGVYGGFEQAMRYFVSCIDLEAIKEKIQRPTELIPSAVTNMLGVHL